MHQVICFIILVLSLTCTFCNAGNTSQMRLEHKLQCLQEKYDRLNDMIVQNPGMLKTKDMAYAKITAYNSEECQTDSTPFHTATGKHVEFGIAAVSRDLERRGWKMGSIIYIAGFGFFEIQDRTNPRLTKTVDIWMKTRGDALHINTHKQVRLLE